MTSRNAISLLRSYTPPGWAAKIKCAPEKYLELATKPTPIHDWNLIPNIPNGFNLSVKRDDLTGNITGGNKIRKLEFILSDAIEKKSTCVITCGSLQSNHCRATAAAAKLLGLDCHLLLRSHDQERDSKVLLGNVLLNRVHGAHVYTVPYESLAGGLNARVLRLAETLKKKGERPYIIPLGGSNSVGTFGIINSFQELMDQGLHSNFDDVVVATGSGGTLAGLAIANYLTGKKVRIHGICVSDNAEYFHDHVEQALHAYRIRSTKKRKICDIIDGYKGQGYTKTTPEELDMLMDICDKTGILLDYCYSLKAVNGMLNEMKENPSRFKGNRVLFIHTGGAFTMFDGTILQSRKLQEQKVTIWKDIDNLEI